MADLVNNPVDLTLTTPTEPQTRDPEQFQLIPVRDRLRFWRRMYEHPDVETLPVETPYHWKAGAAGTMFQDTGQTQPVTADGQEVAWWNNLADTADGTPPTYHTDVINGKPVVRFDGVDQNLDWVLPSSQLWLKASGFSFFAVFRVLSHTNVAGIMGTAPVGSADFAVQGGACYARLDNTVGKEGHPQAHKQLSDVKIISNTDFRSGFYLYEVQFDGTDWRTYINGALDGGPDTQSVGNQNWQYVRMGASGDFGDGTADVWSHMEMAEAAIYYPQITNDEINETRAYFQSEFFPEAPFVWEP